VAIRPTLATVRLVAKVGHPTLSQWAIRFSSGQEQDQPTSSAILILQWSEENADEDRIRGFFAAPRMTTPWGSLQGRQMRSKPPQ
jgi:hypothetical protein